MSRTERKGTPTPVADLPGLIGQEIGVSRWITIDQARIDAFAEVTEDRQFIHIDPEAAKATPFGGTIAHGFLTLSLLSAEDKGGGRWLLKHEVTVEIDGAEKPALIAEWLGMQVVGG